MSLGEGDGTRPGTRTVSTESAQARRQRATLPADGTIGPAPTPPPGAPRDSSRYELLGVHGRGGLGLVHRAHDRALGRDVAIKELIDRTSHLGEVRFLREAMITARLEHPGIVPVHEAGRWADGTPFYAMKLVAGRALRDLIGERKTVDERIALLHHVIAVADAIAYAHGKQIVHRDLKPANVIVGDFGETIVIDWGLAKDLSLGEPVEASGAGASRPSHASDLTMIGSVVGTPAYMAPEQGRGEPVDQRADVFSIGAMLWELCALDHTPPSDPRQRERTLRRAGIDRDLIAIIQKAVASDPAQRYADAGALASDLKAFKSGARITARHHSLPTRLARWVGRHRGLAATAGAALVVLASASALFVRGLASERDRADAESTRATRSADELTLEHAELLLRSDPTAAAATLAGYRGGDALRKRRLLAEAEGLGSAVAVDAPHSQTIWMLAPAPGGGVVSLAEDRAIRLTRDGATTTITSDVSSTVSVAYSAARGLIAFTTARPGVALLDVATHAITPLTTFTSDPLVFSPDGSRLLLLDEQQRLHAWTTTGAPREIRVWPAAGTVQFVAPRADRAVIQRDDGLRVLAEDSDAPIASAAIPGVTALDAIDDDVAIGMADGTIRLLSGALVARAHASVCHDRVHMVQLVPHRELVAFACQDRITGLARFDAARQTLAVVHTFDTRGLARLTPDPSGRYLRIRDESHTAYLYDLDTGLLHHYEGSAGLPAYVLAPSPELPFAVVGDSTGTVRRWRAPSSAARVVLQAADAVFALAFTPDSRGVIASGYDRTVHAIDLAHAGALALDGHTATVRQVRVSPDGQTVLSVGFDRTARTWRRSDGRALRTFTGHGGEVTGADFLADGRVVSVGDDGGLRVWSVDGSDAALVHHQAAAIEALAVLGATTRVAVRDVESRVVVVDVAHPEQAPRVVHAPGADQVGVLRTSRDARWLALGTEAGDVLVYDTATWQVARKVHAPSAIRQLAFDPRGRDLAVATEAGRAPVGHVLLVSLTARARAAWSDVPALVRDVAYAPDGDTLGFLTGDGGTWLYSFARDTWTYARDHAAEGVLIKFSPDGTQLATCDRRGSVVVRDLALTIPVYLSDSLAPGSSR